MEDCLTYDCGNQHCGRGECGACTVLIASHGEAPDLAYACLTLTAACAGHAVTTIEGVGDDVNGLHPVQRAFMAHDAAQCGFCTPGQILAAIALLRESRAASTSPATAWARARPS